MCTIVCAGITVSAFSVSGAIGTSANVTVTLAAIVTGEQTLGVAISSDRLLNLLTDYTWEEENWQTCLEETDAFTPFFDILVDFMQPGFNLPQMLLAFPP